VLLDMALPDLSGLEVLAALGAHPATRDLRVVVLSAGAMPEDVARAREAGACDYWTKPIEVGPFMAGMRQLLDASRRPVAP
jgi:CheY-like chemotaxis protein